MYAVYRSHPGDSRTRSLALSVMVMVILGVYSGLGWALTAGGGGWKYPGLVLFALVALILAKSLVEYMYTAPHLRTMHAVPLQDPQLVRLTQEVATRFKIAPPEIYITHYEVPNAFTLGRKSQPRLIITDGLLDLTYDEVRAVFAHELAHIKSNDSLIKTVASVMRSMLFFDPMIRHVYSRIYVEKEFVADERSARVTGKPQDLVSALRKIYKEVLEFGEGLPSQSVLNYSQKIYKAESIRLQQGIPPDPTLKNRFIVERKMMPGSVVMERVKRLNEMEKEMRKVKRTRRK
ncbi:MAG: M48 family metalloprotease [Theionarchaea archaeon]|nr:M48 family metalloprotease [Theionarchaea archaeon]MBU7039000.1 M48 family metalloprotease [Theionarchaea archaeon]